MRSSGNLRLASFFRWNLENYDASCPPLFSCLAAKNLTSRILLSYFCNPTFSLATGAVEVRFFFFSPPHLFDRCTLSANPPHPFRIGVGAGLAPLGQPAGALRSTAGHLPPMPGWGCATHCRFVFFYATFFIFLDWWTFVNLIIFFLNGGTTRQRCCRTALGWKIGLSHA